MPRNRKGGDEFRKAMKVYDRDKYRDKWEMENMPSFFLDVLGIDVEFYEKWAVNDPELPDWEDIGSWNNVRFGVLLEYIAPLLAFTHEVKMSEGRRRTMKRLAVASNWLRFFIIKPASIPAAFWKEGQVPDSILNNKLNVAPLKVSLMTS